MRKPFPFTLAHPLDAEAVVSYTSFGLLLIASQVFFNRAAGAAKRKPFCSHGHRWQDCPYKATGRCWGNNLFVSVPAALLARWSR
jgi:hypothetical protein